MGTTGTIALSTLISLIGIVILSVLGYFSLSPFVILLGTFIAGFITKEEKFGAVVGFITAISVVLVIGIVLLVLFIIGLFALATLVLFLPFLEWGSDLVYLLITTLIPPAILSPILGAIGGLSGRFIFDREKGPTLPTPHHPSSSTSQIRPPPPSKPKIVKGFEGLRHIPPPTKNALVCLSCGTLNSPQARFCSKCGSRLS